MRLSNKQKAELQVLKYFTDEEITQEEIELFFDWSDKGIGKNEYRRLALNNQAPLYWAKNRRDLQITSYKEDWGTILNVWSFNEDEKWYAKWVSKKLKKPAIIDAWEIAHQ